MIRYTIKANINHEIKNLTICCKVLKAKNDKDRKNNFNRLKK